MIIECINCNKKFEVNSSLIPESGRDILCGSCNYGWFFKPEKNIIPDPPTEKFNIFEDKENKIEEKNSISIQSEHYKANKNDTQKSNDHKLVNKKKSKSSILTKILTYFLVCIISFVALIILLDTFKLLLSKTFPNLELLIYNLFETIKDIYLFLNNLIL